MTVEEAFQFLVDSSTALANDSFGEDAKFILEKTKEASEVLRDALNQAKS